MIGAISDAPHRPERCNRCRHWVEDEATRDPNDADWGFGECRQAAPVLVSSMVGAQLDRPRFGQQDDLNVDLLQLQVATRFPVTSATDWCGRYEAATTRTDGHADLLRERNKLINWLDSDERTEAETDEGCGRLHRLDTLIETTPAVTSSDAVAKLVLLAQVAAEGHDVDDAYAARVLRDVAPIVGMGRLSPQALELTGEA